MKRSSRSSSSMTSSTTEGGEERNKEGNRRSSLTKPSKTAENVDVSEVPSGKRRQQRVNYMAVENPDSTHFLEWTESNSDNVGTRREKAGPLQTESRNDWFCWLCHREGSVICCETCPRVFHLRCAHLAEAPRDDWLCPECARLVMVEARKETTVAPNSLTLDELCELLKRVCHQMRCVPDSEAFLNPVNLKEFPRYKEWITNPMDISTLEKNIVKRHYGCTEAFLADARWILHNCVVFNTLQADLTAVARNLLKVCRREVAEIEVCPFCYEHARLCTPSWFAEPCNPPHPLVWARLKGFPPWPGKAVRSRNGLVDVRFFGAHDRSWIPLKDCFLLSQQSPPHQRGKQKHNLGDCMDELKTHISKLEAKFGTFQYFPLKTLLRLDADGLLLGALQQQFSQLNFGVSAVASSTPMSFRRISDASSEAQTGKDDESCKIDECDDEKQDPTFVVEPGMEEADMTDAENYSSDDSRRLQIVEDDETPPLRIIPTVPSSDSNPSPNNDYQLAAMKLEMDRMQWKHYQEIMELKHNTDLVLAEARGSWEWERSRSIAGIKHNSQVESQCTLSDAKRKRWCNMCGNEALFYCCWSAAYCDFSCQQADWSQHMALCRHNSVSVADSIVSTDKSVERLNSAIPVMQNGGKNCNRKTSIDSE